MSAGLIFVALIMTGAVAVSGLLWLAYETDPYYERLEHLDEELEELIFDEDEDFAEDFEE